MHKLGDQWIEEIDGKEHMVKVGLSMKGEACRGCIYMGRVDECSHPCGCPMKNQFDPTTIVKDLGPVNEDGCLPAPWDTATYPYLGIYKGKYSCYAEDDGITIRTIGDTGQQAIDTWNRRAM